MIDNKLVKEMKASCIEGSLMDRGAVALEAALARLAELEKQEPVGHFLRDFGEEGRWQQCKHEMKDMTEPLYAAAGASISKPVFPTTLHKMWTGTEVQEWIDYNWPSRRPLNVVFDFNQSNLVCRNVTTISKVTQ